VDTIDIVLAEGGRMAIEELVVPEGTDAFDRRHACAAPGAVLLAVRSPQGALSVAPDDGHQLSPEDLVVAMGSRAQLDALADALRPIASTS